MAGDAAGLLRGVAERAPFSYLASGQTDSYPGIVHVLDLMEIKPLSFLGCRSKRNGIHSDSRFLSSLSHSENVEMEDISVSGALEAVRSLFKDDTKSCSDHIFNVFPSEEEEDDFEPDLRCTTFDLWAGPRLISAAAVLSVRCCDVEGVKPSTNANQDLGVLRADVLDTLFAILSRSISAVAQVDNILLLLTELIRTSFQGQFSDNLSTTQL